VFNPNPNLNLILNRTKIGVRVSSFRVAWSVAREMSVQAASDEGAAGEGDAETDDGNPNHNQESFK
jgi:hypothetical protein